MMMRRLLLAGTLVAVAATSAAGQELRWTLLDSYSTDDSALAVLTGDTATVQLELYNGTYGVGVSSYSITIFLDDARVRLVRADSVPGYNMPSPTITPGSGLVTLSATGTGSTALYVMPLATLYFEMNAGATQGSLLSFGVTSLIAGDGTTSLLDAHRTRLLNVCQAAQMWGDLDVSRRITSRDALIAITAAVGLPIGGYDVTVGDVDEDGQTGTRDALYVLNEGVGLETYTRTGEARANHCAPLAPWPDDVAFWGSGTNLFRVAAGDTIVQAVGTTGTGYAPSWAPDGSRILISRFVSAPIYLYEDLVAVAPDGSTADTLGLSTIYYEYAGAWSPDGTRIAFLSYRPVPTNTYALFVANADGTNQVAVSDSLYADYGSAIDWSPDGSQILVRAYDQRACCTYGIWAVNADGAGQALLPLSTAGTGPPGPNAYDPHWSPAGGSYVYDHSYRGRVFSVPAVLVDTLGQPATFLQYNQDYPVWTSGGIAWRSSLDNEYYFQQGSGRILRLTRVTDGSRAAVRRGGRYVASVSVSPTSAVLSLSGTRTAQLTETVLNDLGGAITPGSGIQWSTSDPLVASVDQTGLVTAVATGTVTITASAGGWRSGTATVTVNP